MMMRVRRGTRRLEHDDERKPCMEGNKTNCEMDGKEKDRV